MTLLYRSRLALIFALSVGFAACGDDDKTQQAAPSTQESTASETKVSEPEIFGTLKLGSTKIDISHSTCILGVGNQFVTAHTEDDDGIAMLQMTTKDGVMSIEDFNWTDQQPGGQIVWFTLQPNHNNIEDSILRVSGVVKADVQKLDENKIFRTDPDAAVPDPQEFSLELKCRKKRTF